jgi:hypothetical protein
LWHTSFGEIIVTANQKEQIDKMTQFEMAYMWRFAKLGEPLLQGDTGDYFVEVFKEKGGMTPEISRLLGW